MSAPLKVLAGRTVTGSISARITIDGRKYINFFGAGYLALSDVTQIRAAALQALQERAPFARQLPAAHGAIDPIFDEVERAGASACGTETSVYFASGYFIGMAALASLDHAVDVLLLDESAHYSLQGAAKLYGRPAFTFAHCDVESLRDALKKHVKCKARPLVLTDGVFATTGRLAPLAAYAKELAIYDGRLLIDESHAFGVVGKNGRGAGEYCGVESIAKSGATLSKAYCAQGAIMGCSAAAAARARSLPPLAAACAGSAISAAVATASFAYVVQHPEVRSTVRRLTDHLRKRLRELGLAVLDSPAPIVSFRHGSRGDMQGLQRRAFDRGVYIHYSNYIGAGAEGMIRCAVFRDHCEDDIEALISALG